MSQITPRETELFFSENHDMFTSTKNINVEKLIKILPVGLNTVAKKNYLRAFGESITKQKYLKFLKNMTHGSDYISFDYLIKHYKLQVNPDTQMIQFNDKLSYKNICEEALYMWWLFRIIKQDAFIGKYFNQEHLHIIRQSKIESDILPANSNFKFDFGFANLNILLEVNEYAHEQPDAIIEDKVKNDLALLCGHTCITLRVRDVFDMQESEYNKLSDTEVHNMLSTSKYLQTFAKEFIYKITSALLQFTDVRNDYIMVLFKQMLQSRIQDITKNIIEINKEKNLLQIQYTNNKNNNTIIEYKECIDAIKLDLVQLNMITSTLNDICNSTSFINLFNIKHKCTISEIVEIITFQDIVLVLGIDINDISTFKIFLNRCVYKTKNIPIDDIRITWEQLSEIITNYDNRSAINKILQMYYREVGRSYEIIIKMIKSHTNSLQTNKTVLTNYVNYVNIKSMDINEILRIKNKKLLFEKNEEKKITDKIISNLRKELYDITKFNKIPFDINRIIPIVDKQADLEFTKLNALYSTINISESDYMINAVKEFDKLSLQHVQLTEQILDTDNSSESELDSDSDSD